MNYNTRTALKPFRISQALQGARTPADAPVVPDIGAETFDGGFITTDLRLVFPDLPAAGVVPSIEDEPVPVLLELPLVTLQFTLIGTQVHSAARLS